MTVFDTRRGSRAEHERAVLRALDIVGLPASRHTGGKALDPYRRRLTEIARRLVGNLRLILLDEPGGRMAYAEMHELHRIIGGIHETLSVRVLLVDHDMNLVRGSTTRSLFSTSGT